MNEEELHLIMIFSPKKKASFSTTYTFHKSSLKISNGSSFMVYYRASIVMAK